MHKLSLNGGREAFSACWGVFTFSLENFCTSRCTPASFWFNCVVFSGYVMFYYFKKENLHNNNKYYQFTVKHLDACTLWKVGLPYPSPNMAFPLPAGNVHH